MNPIKYLKNKISQLQKNHEKLERIQEALGRIELRQISSMYKSKGSDLTDYEFRVFSQWGEDGIIQYLVHTIKIEKRIFVELGVENYIESNTRFLLINNNWSGLVIDGNEDNIRYIKNDSIYWRHNLKALKVFITRENINDLLLENGLSGDIGLLSIDIDGNDYWVWEAIECVNPRIVICEYNSFFGDKTKVTIPYEKDFVRDKAHFSNLYYGASISALDDLARRKGYSLVGSNSAGNNVFFVKNDLVSKLPTYSTQEVYKEAKFRESRDAKGELTFLDYDHRIDLIKEKELYDLDSGSLIKIKDLQSSS